MNIKQRRGVLCSTRGFTLIEILVVVGIISILIGLGVTSYSAAQKKSRDARRQGDVQAIRDAYEQHYSLCSFDYPSYTPGNVPTSISCDSPSEVIMETVPTDPLGDAYEIVAGDSDAKTYTICPPVVRDVGGGDYRMETEDCTDVNKTCCVSNVQ